MNQQLELYRIVEREANRYRKLADQWSADLEKLPKGTLMKRADGRMFWTYAKGTNRVQIKLNEEDKKIINQLKYKRYIKESLNNIRKIMKQLDELLQNKFIYDPIGIGKRLKPQYEGLKEIPVFLEGDVNPDDWKQGNKTVIYNDGLIHPSEMGLMTRSKSEAMITSKLEVTEELDFEYEAEVKLKNGEILRPDFKILNLNKRKIIYYEHFGMMDDPEYAKKAVEKIIKYAENEIILGVNLVVTLETREKPLTINEIKSVIEKIKMM